MQSVSRRGFMAASLTAASAVRVLGANERIRMGIVGAGSRGSYLIDQANRVGGIEWAAVSDAWDVRREQSRKVTSESVGLYADYRRLLDRKDINAVIVATWDNNHTLVASAACQAGKDVYVEKPMTSRPEQGPPMVRATRQTGRIVQVGVQQRSTPHFWEAKEQFIDTGRLGKVHMVRTIWNNNSGYMLKPPPGMDQKPAGLDWDGCLGTLPKIPWDPKMFFNRYAYLDLCCGQTVACSCIRLTSFSGTLG